MYSFTNQVNVTLFPTYFFFLIRLNRPRIGATKDKRRWRGTCIKHLKAFCPPKHFTLHFSIMLYCLLLCCLSNLECLCLIVLLVPISLTNEVFVDFYKRCRFQGQGCVCLIYLLTYIQQEFRHSGIDVGIVATVKLCDERMWALFAVNLFLNLKHLFSGVNLGMQVHELMHVTM